MPELDGYDATRVIRAMETARGPTDGREELSRVPIVAMTAHAMRGDKEKCIAAGMDDYLAKPFSRGELSTVLARWLLSRTMSQSEDSNPQQPSLQGASRE